MKSRKRTIGVAYAATGTAKVVGALVQLAVLPLAARALGAEAFGLLFTVAALASFPLIAMAGFSPAASVLIARAKASSDHDRAGAYFWSLLLWSMAIGAVLSAVAYFAVTAFDLPGGSEGKLTLIFLLLLLASFVAAPIDGARAAFGESHYNSIFAVFGSVLTLSMIVLATGTSGTAYYFTAIYFAPVVVQVFNLLLFVFQHRADIGRPRLDNSVRKEIAELLTANIQAQSGMVLYLHGGIYLLASIFGTASVAVVGAFVRVAALVHSMLLSLFSPVLPTITHAVVQGERKWVGKGLRYLSIIAIAVLMVQAGITIAGGNWIARDLFEISTGQSAVFFAALAFFLFCYSATHLLFVTRLAIPDASNRGSRILAAAVLGLGIAMLVAQDDMTLFLLLQAISMAAIAMAAYGHELWHVFRATSQDVRG